MKKTINNVALLLCLALAVIAPVWLYLPHREAKLEERCHNILRQIEAGTTSWGLEQGHSTGFAVIEENPSLSGIKIRDSRLDFQ